MQLLMSDNYQALTLIYDFCHKSNEMKYKNVIQMVFDVCLYDNKNLR